MSQFIESIKCENGRLANLAFHNLRFNQTRQKFFGAAPLDLFSLVSIPEHAKNGIFKCRILYGSQITRIEFIPHVYRLINRLKLVHCNSINYRYKHSDRNMLLKLFEQREDCDDILIVKNGFITDSFSANVIFFDRDNWYTPNTPLLPGTRRAQLLKKGNLTAINITTADLKNFDSACLINAMQGMNETPLIPIKHIYL